MRGFDIPLEQFEAGEEAEQDRLERLERNGPCPNHHYRAMGYCPFCKESLPREEPGDAPKA